MTGIVGAAGASLGDTDALVERMVGALRRAPDAAVATWSRRDAVLGTVSRSRASVAASRGGSLRAVCWGDIAPSCSAAVRRRPAGRRPEPADVVLELFERSGPAAIAELDGSFALAIFDEAAARLVLANDRLSSRPLFWSAIDGNVVFGTQVHAVLQFAAIPRAIDPGAVMELLCFQRVHGSRTLNPAVSMLPPASVLTASGGRASVTSWFDMDYRPERRTEREWSEELAAAFSASTRDAIADIDEVGLLLSGGLDSRMIVAAADRPITCLHFNDWRNRELLHAERIAASRGFPFRYLERSQDHYIEIFDAAVDLGDGLYSFVHAHPLELVPRELDVVLHGFAPELFFRGTNLPHRARKLLGRKLSEPWDSSMKPGDVPSRILTDLKYSLARAQPDRFLAPELRREFPGEIDRTVDALLDEARSHSQDPYDWFTWADTRYHAKYPSFLFERSIRPFHDERSVVFRNHVLDLHLRMPVSARADGRVWMGAVRRLHPRVASTPDANTNRSAFTPAPVRFALDLGASVARRVRTPPSPAHPWQTQGSWPRFGPMIVHHAAFRELVRSVIHDDEALDPTIFDRAAVRAAFDDHVAGRADLTNALLAMTTFGEWHRRYGPPGRGLSR